MSVPIDELLISVEIEQGSNLEALHKMLKDFQKSGGKVGKTGGGIGGVSKKQLEGFAKRITSLTTKIEKFINSVLKPLQEKFPEMLNNIDSSINSLRSWVGRLVDEVKKWGDEVKKIITSQLSDFLEKFGAVNEELNEKELYDKVGFESLSEDLKTFSKQTNKLLKTIVDNIIGIGKRVGALKDWVTKRSNIVVTKLTKIIESQTKKILSAVKSGVVDEELKTVLDVLLETNKKVLGNVRTINTTTKELVKSLKVVNGFVSAISPKLELQKTSLDKIGTHLDRQFVIDEATRKFLVSKHKRLFDIMNKIESGQQKISDSIRAVSPAREFDLPGLKPLTLKTGSKGGQDQFWRTLLSIMMERSPENMEKYFGAVKGRMMRPTGDMSPKQRKEIADLLGFKVTSKETGPSNVGDFLKKVIESLKGINPVDLIAGLFNKPTEEVKEDPVKTSLEKIVKFIDEVDDKNVELNNGMSAVKDSIDENSNKLDQMKRNYLSPIKSTLEAVKIDIGEENIQSKNDRDDIMKALKVKRRQR